MSVLYAGSLVHVMVDGIAPAFSRATGDRVAGDPGGSLALAHAISGRLQRADVFISAEPSVNASLMGRQQGGWVSWYVPFAASPLVLAYNPRGPFATALQTQPWYQVALQPGFRLGRTDPKLDPKGALTVRFVQAAASYYHRPRLAAELLGGAENPRQVFPETALVGRLQAGEVDAGFLYAEEAMAAHLPYLSLPPAITPQAEYTVTILRAAPDARAAVAFVRFLLGPQGQAILRRSGFGGVHPALVGQPAQVPPGLRRLLA